MVSIFFILVKGYPLSLFGYILGGKNMWENKLEKSLSKSGFDKQFRRHVSREDS
jgi:hypothetical protein